MPRPCGHSDVVPKCHLCKLYRTRADYRAIWDGTPLPEKKRKPQKKPLCLYLGKRLEFDRKCVGQCLHACDKGHEARPGKTCQTCPDYSADSPSVPDSPSAGDSSPSG